MPDDTLSTFARRVWTAVGIVMLVVLLVYFASVAFRVILLLLAGVLFAVMLNGLANQLRRFLPLPYKGAVGVVTLLLFGVLFVFSWRVGPSIAAQAGEMQEALMAAVAQVEETISDQTWGESVLDAVPDTEGLIERMGSSGVLGQVTGVVSAFLSIMFDAFIMVFIGIYVALNPRVYVDNGLRLFPKHRRARLRETIVQSVKALKLWLWGQFLSMAFVAVFVLIGLLLLGVPLAPMLAVLSFFLGFIPYLGPILAAVPALLVAFLVGPEMVLYVAILYFVLENLQSYIVIPLVQEWVVALPPVLLIMVQLLFAAFAGILGIALASPIAVVAVVMIQMLYVSDVLGDNPKVIGTPDDEVAH